MMTGEKTAGCLKSYSRGQLPWILLFCLLHSSAAEKSREAVHDDPFVVYPYRLTSTSPFGRILDSALPGSEVPVDPTLPHFDFKESTRYLTLQLTRNEFYVNEHSQIAPTNTTNPTVSSRLSKPGRLSRDPPDGDSRGLGGDKKSPGGTSSGGPLLPAGVRIDISGEEGNVARVSEKMAFTLDENLHIIVGGSHDFKDVDGIEFWVVAIQQEKGRRDRVVSNPLSFVVKIEHSQPEGQGAPVYAGIVVLVVCLFALLIPLTVRTKRRLREGKPVCACGSSAKKLEERMHKEAETGTGSHVTTGKASGSSEEQDSFSRILEGRQPVETLYRAGETIQSKNLRSVSLPHFQPHWLDPHYDEVYERPVFRTPASKMSTRVSFVSDLAEASTSTAEAITSTAGSSTSMSRPEATSSKAGPSSSKYKTEPTSSTDNPSTSKAGEKEIRL